MNKQMPSWTGRLLIVSVLAAGAAGAAVASAADAKPNPDAGARQGDQKPAPATPDKPKPEQPRKYRPRPGSPPATRTIGAVRGKDDEDSTGRVAILAPDGVLGFTTQEHPVLFWSISRPTKERVQITINDLTSGDSVVDVTLEGGQEAGIHRFDTSKVAKDKPFALKPDVPYECVVLIPRPEGVNARSAKSTCRLKRLDPAGASPASPDAAGPAARANAYAEAGVWFDYLAALDDVISADPLDRTWREGRDALLREQRLADVTGKGDRPAARPLR